VEAVKDTKFGTKVA